ncbi:MAG: hypothetical protein WDN50_14320 [Bradyrhizobium sp.]
MLIKVKFDAGMPDRHYPRQTKGAVMHATAKAFSNTLPSIPPDSDILETLALFCGVGWLIVLVLALLGSSFLPTDPETLNVMYWI